MFVYFVYVSTMYVIVFLDSGTFLFCKHDPTRVLCCAVANLCLLLALVRRIWMGVAIFWDVTC